MCFGWRCFIVSLLHNALKAFNIRKGDTLFIRADLSKIKRFSKDERLSLIDVILDYLGPEGTLVGLTFSRFFHLKQLLVLYFL